MTILTTPVRNAINIEVALQRMGGNTTLLATLVAYFLEDAPQLLEQLHDGLRINSLEQVTLSAHSLRGLAATFEATPFVTLAMEIENLGRVGDASRLNELTAQLDIEFARLLAALQTLAA